MVVHSTMTGQLQRYTPDEYWLSERSGPNPSVRASTAFGLLTTLAYTTANEYRVEQQPAVVQDGSMVRRDDHGRAHTARSAAKPSHCGAWTIGSNASNAPTSSSWARESVP